MNIELLIFDLDGTLVDSLPDLTDSLNYAAQKLNYPQVAESDVPAMVGNGVRMLIAKAFSLEAGSDDLNQALAVFMEYYSQNLTKRTLFYPNVEETIRRLKDKKLAVLSNKPDGFTQSIIKELGLSPYFNFVLGSTDRISRKPSAEPILHIMEQLQASPEKTMMIGDGDADIKAGKNAGVKTCGLSYGYRGRKELEPLKPDYILDDIAEICNLIK